MARIRFINNDGAGFADMVTVPDGHTVEEFLKSKNIDAKQFTIRLNRQECVLENDVLKDGDRLTALPVAGTVPGTTQLKANDVVSATPKNIAGAAYAAAQQFLIAVFND